MTAPGRGTPQQGGFRVGRRLGVDVGKVRVGVAISDPDGILATPLVTLRRDITEPPEEAEEWLPADIVELARLVAEHEVVEVVVGLPITLAGTESYAAIYARTYSQLLARAIAPIPVHLADERMSTAVASRRLSERGVRGGRQRFVVDQAAAVVILQGWIDARRRDV